MTATPDFGAAQPYFALLNQIQNTYGYTWWAMQDPEIQRVILDAVAGGWTEARIQGAIQATSWWQTHSAAQRAWLELQGTDPASAATQTAARQAEISDQAASMGLNLSAGRLAEITSMSLSTGATGTQITDMLVGELQYGQVGYGTVTATQDQLQALAGQYAVPVSDTTLFDWAAQIAGGTATVDGFSSYVKEQAKSLFPALSGAIDAGITVRQYVDPYVQIASQELGINPYTVDLMDPKWNAAIHQVDPGSGQPVSMSLSSWVAKLRSDPIYGYDKTINGQAAATALAQSIDQMFGYAA